MGQTVDFFDRTTLKEAESQKIDSTQVNQAETDREKKILQKLQDIEIATDVEFDKKKKNWDKYERFMYGNQWAVNTKDTTEYNMSGDPIYTINIANDLDRGDMPKRTENYVFPLLQTELALINELNPTVRVVSNNYESRDRVTRLNLFLDTVFGTKVRPQYARGGLDAEVLGQGFLKINIAKTKPGEIPFSCIAERAKNIKFDPLADSWEDVRWVIFTVNKYCYEVKNKYPSFKSGKKPYEVLTLKEFWLKENDRWNQYVVYSGSLLKIGEGKNSYPVNVFELFRLYMAPEGAWGISEVSLMMEDQIIINKRASQMDFHTSMLVDPPLEFYGKGLVSGEEKKLPLKAGEIYTAQIPNVDVLKPIKYQPVDPGVFLSAIQSSLSHAQLTLGIQNAVLGQNETGTYGAAHFQKEKDSVMTRVKQKSSQLKHALKSLGYKSLILAKEYLKGGAYFDVWDEYNKKYQRLTVKDFENAEVDVVTVETVDAATLDPLTRIEKMIELKQYAPQFPDDYLYLSIETIQPGFFPKSFMNQLNDKIAFETKAKQVQMDAQLKQLVLQNQQLDMQLKQIAMQEQQMNQQQLVAQQQAAMQSQMVPQEQTIPPQTVQAAPEGAAPIPSPTPSEPSGESVMQAPQGQINWDELVQSSSQTIAKLRGIPIEQAQVAVMQVLEQINQQMPDATDMEKVAEYVKRLKG